MKNKESEKKQESQDADNSKYKKLIQKFKQNQNIPKKYLDSIFIFKKSVFIDEINNIDKNFKYEMLEMKKEQEEETQLEKQFTILTEDQGYLQLEEEKDIQLSYGEETFKLGKWQTKLISNGKLSDESMNSKDQKTQAIQEWDHFMINCGYPILSLHFSYRSINETQLSEVESDSKHKDQLEKNRNSQILAVSLDTCQTKNKIDTNQFHADGEINQLDKLHLLGKAYTHPGLIAFFKIKQQYTGQSEGNASEFAIPHIYYFIKTESPVSQLKWAPIYEEQNSQHIGILGMIQLDGSFIVAAIPKKPFLKQKDAKEFQQQQQQQQQCKNVLNANLMVGLKPQLQIKISQDVLLQSFEWITKRGCSEVLVGDQIGNMYWIKLKANTANQQWSQYEIIRVYEHAHTGAIFDIKYYWNNLQDDTELFATCSFDGMVNIFDLQDTHLPIYKQEFSQKAIRGLSWDKGGKYLLILRDENQNAITLLSFFPIRTLGIYQIQEKAEYRLYLSKFCSHQGSCVTSQIFSSNLYIGTDQGYVYSSNCQSLRQIVVKRPKTGAKKSAKSQQQLNTVNQVLTSCTQLANLNEYQLNISVRKENQEQKEGSNNSGDNSSDSEDESEERATNQDQSEFVQQKMFASVQSENEEINLKIGQRITSIDLSPNNLYPLRIRSKNGKNNWLESFLSIGQFSGLLRIQKVYCCKS
eukprot:TRINITY_DN7034_c0_g1_i4.p1 TRINITY_DN7034_c0_g1~~TRINITY_DN7034_c0_g1_i4.p1  ORF type:complete len:696 (-),score=121.22 TRINITY_DN7034_c0_g1_i4:237-2324(-)